MSASYLIRIALLTACQIITYTFTYEVLWRLYIYIVPEFRRDLSWGITAKYSVWVFVVISLIGALACQLLFLRHQLLVQFLCIFVFTALLVNSWAYAPYRVMLLVGCAILGFFVPFLFIETIFKDKVKS